MACSNSRSAPFEAPKRRSPKTIEIFWESRQLSSIGIEKVFARLGQARLFAVWFLVWVLTEPLRRLESQDLQP